MAAATRAASTVSCRRLSPDIARNRNGFSQQETRARQHGIPLEKPFSLPA
jgi:hypothetical protein